MVIGYEMNLENNNNTFPVMAPERVRVRTYARTHAQTYNTVTSPLHTSIYTNKQQIPQFTLNPPNSLHSITTIQPTEHRRSGQQQQQERNTVTGVKGGLELQDKKKISKQPKRTVARIRVSSLVKCRRKENFR